MKGLADHDPRWDPTARAGRGGTFEDERLLLATDFEGGNGENLRRLGTDHYAVDLEKEPGNHRFSGQGYYACLGLYNKLRDRRPVRVRFNASSKEIWGEQSASMVLRHQGEWSQLPVANIHRIPDLPDSLDVDIPLPPGGAGDEGTIFVSNYHWWPFSEALAWLGTLDDTSVRRIGTSLGGRPIHAVEFGDPANPAMVHTQTMQPSEMGSLACRAMVDYLRSPDPGAARIRSRFHLCFVPETNPDGSVLGLGLSDSQGRLPFFEGDLAAAHDPEATPETRAVWAYLEEKLPWLFWEWHSNHWKRRPGHMLLRYRPECLADEARRAVWRDVDERLLALPDTHHGNWTSRDEGLYQSTLGFQAVVRLGAISCMIKQHDKFPLEQSRDHAIQCLQSAADCYR